MERFIASNVGRAIVGVAVAVIITALSPHPEGYPEATPKWPLVIARVGFVGLGAMGEPMAGALRRAGFEVTASVHRHRDALDRLRSQGVAEAADPGALAGEVGAVIVCVPDAPQVEDALFGSRGVVTGAKAALLVIDMSTISPVASRRLCPTSQRTGNRLRRRAGKRRPGSRAIRLADYHGWSIGRSVRAGEATAARDGQIRTISVRSAWAKPSSWSIRSSSRTS